MSEASTTRLSTGITGLDEILHGGLIPGRAYLVSGGPGSGKTMLGLHFLTAGAAAGESALFITLEEPEKNIRKNAGAVGFDLKGIDFLDLSPTSEAFTQMQTYDLFSPAEVEQQPISREIIDEVQRTKPQRVFVDSMTQFRYLAVDAFQFRKQVLAFLRFLTEQGATVLFTSEAGADVPDDDLRFMSDGIIQLAFSRAGRDVSVAKFRGSDFRRGTHSMRLMDAGMAVFPRLLPEAHRRQFDIINVPSGVPELDDMLHGGLERGTVTIVSGPSGVGKTTLGLQFMKEAAGRGERSVVYTFEESPATMVHRCESIGLPLRAMMERNTLSIVPVEPLRFTPDEFANLVRREVEEDEARIVMIDSTAGYGLSFQGEDIDSYLHALCKYLKNMGVTVILINEVEAVTGQFQATELGISYMSDTIVFIRYMERSGEIRRVLGILKKRLSDFEKTLCDLEITRCGIVVGKSLTDMQGILSGAPETIEPDEQES